MQENQQNLIDLAIKVDQFHWGKTAKTQKRFKFRKNFTADLVCVQRWDDLNGGVYFY